MRALKVSVIVMAVLIIVGIAILATTVIKRMGGEAKPLPEVTAHIPEGFHIASLMTTDNRLVIHLKSEKGEKVIVINLSSGAEVYQLQSSHIGSP